MHLHRRSNEKGVILIVTLWLLAALSLLALGLAYRMRLEGRITGYRHDRMAMLELARGAVAVAKARLDASNPQITSLGEAWARPFVLTEEYFGGIAPESLRRYRVECIVFDERGKLNVNTATRRQLSGVPGCSDEIAGAIVDWRDEDDIESEYGAESAYYGTLAPPYECKNAPLDTIWELEILHGVTPEAFRGAALERLVDTSNPLWQYRDDGLRDFLTTYGDGRVCLNTAPAEVLLAIPGFEYDMVSALEMHMAGPDGLLRTEDDKGVENFEELMEISWMSEFAILQAQMHCTLGSDYFRARVRVTDTRSPAVLHLEVDFNRGDNGMEIICRREG